MPKYLVQLPIAGYVSCEVEAESKEQALSIAKDTDFSPRDIQEFNIYENLMSGNVCQAEVQETYICEIPEEGE